MPSEREHLALSALLVVMPEPVLSLDTKGRVELANPASCLLFGQSQAKLRNHPVAQRSPILTFSAGWRAARRRRMRSMWW